MWRFQQGQGEVDRPANARPYSQHMSRSSQKFEADPIALPAAIRGRGGTVAGCSRPVTLAAAATVVRRLLRGRPRRRIDQASGTAPFATFASPAISVDFGVPTQPHVRKARPPRGEQGPPEGGG